MQDDSMMMRLTVELKNGKILSVELSKPLIHSLSVISRRKKKTDSEIILALLEARLQVDSFGNLELKL